MKSATTPAISANGQSIRIPRNMNRLLNYNFLDLTNKAPRSKILGMPMLHCDTKIYPDFLALYPETGLYHKTFRTAVTFYSYDIVFDGKNGLFQAIYFHDTPRLDYFQKRFSGVNFIISPDYSVFGDIPEAENQYRIWKARIVSLWLGSATQAVIIPNVSYANERSFPLYFAGLEQCKVVAFSTKAHMRNSKERALLKSAVRYAVDHLPLDAIIVYSACGLESHCLKLFQYAISKGIQVVIPENTLHHRNVLLQREAV